MSSLSPAPCPRGMPRRLAACIAILLLTAACATTPKAPPPSGQDVFILLPDEQGKTGSIIVSGAGGKRLLSEPRQAVTVAPPGRPPPSRPPQASDAVHPVLQARRHRADQRIAHEGAGGGSSHQGTRAGGRQRGGAHRHRGHPALQLPSLPQARAGGGCPPHRGRSGPLHPLDHLPPGRQPSPPHRQRGSRATEPPRGGDGAIRCDACPGLPTSPSSSPALCSPSSREPCAFGLRPCLSPWRGRSTTPSCAPSFMARWPAP